MWNDHWLEQAVRRFNFSSEPPEILYLSPSWFPSLLLCFQCFLICCYVTCLLLLNQPYCFSGLCSLTQWILFSFLLSLFHGVPFSLCFAVIVNSFFLERLIASTNTHRVLDSLMRSPPEIFSQFWSLLETVTGPISRNHMLTCLIGSGLLLFGCNKGFLLVCKSPNWAPC